MTTATHPSQFHPHTHPAQIKLASGLTFLAGLYLWISAWIEGSRGGAESNGIIFGIIVAILGAARFGGARPWTAWLAALIGIWMIISPWVYGFAGEAWMWNAIVIGIIILCLGVWAAMAGRDSTTTAMNSNLPPT